MARCCCPGRRVSARPCCCGRRQRTPQSPATRVQPAAGAEFERDLGFAGLHQLLGPLLGSVRELSPAYRSALWVALGVRAGSPPGQLMVANAVRALLALAARRGP